jgi:hypothetical protein
MESDLRNLDVGLLASTAANGGSEMRRVCDTKLEIKRKPYQDKKTRGEAKTGCIY